MQTSFLQNVHAASVEIFHRGMLLGKGRISKLKQDKKRQDWQVMLAKTSMRNHFLSNLSTEYIDLELAAVLL